MTAIFDRLLTESHVSHRWSRRTNYACPDLRLGLHGITMGRPNTWNGMHPILLVDPGVDSRFGMYLQGHCRLSLILNQLLLHHWTIVIVRWS